MYSDEDRIKVVHSEAKRLEQYLSSLSPEDWRRPSACDRWTVADVVAHLAGMSIAERITKGLQGDVSPLPDRPAAGTITEDDFREGIAQRAISQRERLGDQLLSAFVEGNEELDRVLSGIRPQDWDNLCYHAMGPEPVRVWIDMRITELTMHGWDIRSSFDTKATLSPESLTALINTIPRAVRRAFRPNAARLRPVRYRIEVTGPISISHDIVLSPEGARSEPARASQADVTFRCDAQTYALVMFGRLGVDAAIGDGRMSFQGDKRLVDEFGRSFVGG